MAITTLASYKSILGITSTDVPRDNQITALIPQVEADFLRIRNRPFDIGVTLQVTVGATVAGNISVTIDTSICTIAVLAGDNIARVARKIMSALTGGYWYNVTLDNATLTIWSKYADTEVEVAFDDTDATGVTATVTDTATLYPTGAEFTAVKMIQFHMGAGKGVGISSESLGDHSIVYDTALGSKISDYPKAVVGGIKRYAGWV
jgi:hypothetical protein